MSATVPDDETIQSVISSMHSALPGLGTAKLHTAVIDAHPEWKGVVGEKRIRRVMANSKKDAETESPIRENDALTTKSKTKKKKKAKVTSRATYPTSSLLPDSALTLPLSVAVRYFDKQKGKGLVALRRIEEGETLWKEDPWILAPEWDIFDLQQRAVACAHCTTPFSPIFCPCGLLPALLCALLHSSLPLTIRIYPSPSLPRPEQRQCPLAQAGKIPGMDGPACTFARHRSRFVGWRTGMGRRQGHGRAWDGRAVSKDSCDAGAGDMETSVEIVRRRIPISPSLENRCKGEKSHWGSKWRRSCLAMKVS